MSQLLELPARIDRTISATVKALCGGRDVSADALAAHLGVSHGTINSRMRCRTSWTAAEVGLIAEFFGVRITDIFSGMDGRFNPDPAGAANQPGSSSASDTELMQYRSLTLVAA